MATSFKPNTTMNIPVERLEQVREFLPNQATYFKSRNDMIDKSLLVIMDHWEDLKKYFEPLKVA